MAADGNDDPGVLGNLPRARPGRRSAKRGAGATDASGSSAGERPAASAQRAKRSAASSPAASGSPRRTGAASSVRSRRSVSTPPPRPAQAAHGGSSGGDPITQAVRLAGKVAETGVKTASALIKRLPGR